MDHRTVNFLSVCLSFCLSAQRSVSRRRSVLCQSKGRSFISFSAAKLLLFFHLCKPFKQKNSFFLAYFPKKQYLCAQIQKKLILCKQRHKCSNSYSKSANAK